MDWVDISAWVLPLIFAITLHEAAHGWMAARFGDATATRLGRVTLNPFRHIDPFGTLILPGLLLLSHSPLLFGYAKPVPVRFENLSPPRAGMCAVALAGIGLNLILALLSGIALHLDHWITPEEAPWLFLTLYRSITINCVLVIFNLIPLLPFDGGRAIYALLPAALQRIFKRTERFGMSLIFLLILLPALSDEYLHTEFHLVENLLGTPLLWLVELLMHITGNGNG